MITHARIINNKNGKNEKSTVRVALQPKTPGIESPERCSYLTEVDGGASRAVSVMSARLSRAWVSSRLLYSPSSPLPPPLSTSYFLTFKTMRPSSQLLLPAFTGLTVFTSGTAAWGMLGHRTVALLASRYLLPETALWVKGLLPGSQSMVTASTWPDYYAHTPGGRYSAPWHWIDSKDDPPHTCSVNYSRDCHGEEGCIVSAIANMVRSYSF